jgi:hypothetical protein
MENTNLFKFDLNKLNEIKDILICPICYDILDNPVMETTNQHVFCYKCITQCETSYCPICKAEIQELQKPLLISKLLETIIRKCILKDSGCDFEGNFVKYKEHNKICEFIKDYNKELLSELTQVKSEMYEILETKINPHLKSQHSEIYENIVKDWEWLISDTRDWKWWWWSSNPWFQKPCVECNILWHEFEDPMEVLEKKRKLLLNKLIIL